MYGFRTALAFGFGTGRQRENQEVQAADGLQLEIGFGLGLGGWVVTMGGRGVGGVGRSVVVGRQLRCTALFIPRHAVQLVRFAPASRTCPAVDSRLAATVDGGYTLYLIEIGGYTIPDPLFRLLGGFIFDSPYVRFLQLLRGFRIQQTPVAF